MLVCFRSDKSSNMLQASYSIKEGQGIVDISKITTGINPPHDINVIIEIPQGGVPVKYELDKESGAMFVDRFLHVSMVYPANYGFIPHTLSADGDPCDVLVIAQMPVMPGAVVRSRPIGALIMEDEKGRDEKILAVPADALHPFYKDVRSHEDLPLVLRQQIEHFFKHYKELESGKWSKVIEWVGYEETCQLITQSIGTQPS